jgi:hypothetical protein
VIVASSCPRCARMTPVAPHLAAVVLPLCVDCRAWEYVDHPPRNYPLPEPYCPPPAEVAWEKWQRRQARLAEREAALTAALPDASIDRAPRRRRRRA